MFNDIDPSLMQTARPVLLDALVTFFRPGWDFVRTSQEIAQAAKVAGFSKRGRRKLLDYLYALVEELDDLGENPLNMGRRVEPRERLFSAELLKGLFDQTDANGQMTLFEIKQPDASPDRAFIDQLIADTRLYTRSEDILSLWNFTARMRHIAPFNAMLLHVQKPGLSYAATARDWWERFKRKPKAHARPLVTMRIAGPVDFMFDVLDVEPPLDESVYFFPASGDIPPGWIQGACEKLGKQSIDVVPVHHGDYNAGQVRLLEDHDDETRHNQYEIVLNVSHPEPTQLVTLVHELAHLYLGHCGEDIKRGVKARRPRELPLREVEAESVAYVVAKRSGVAPRSETYLVQYQGAFEELDVHAVLQTAGKIEKLLRLPFDVRGAE